MRNSKLSNNRALILANAARTGGGGGNGSLQAANQGKSLLLEQMELVLSSGWKGRPLDQQQQQQQQQQQASSRASSTTSAEAEAQLDYERSEQEQEFLEMKRQQEEKKWLDDAIQHNVETCRSALILYASASGTFAPNLKNIAEYLVDVVERLADERLEHEATIRSLEVQLQQKPSSNSSQKQQEGEGGYEKNNNSKKNKSNEIYQLDYVSAGGGEREGGEGKETSENSSITGSLILPEHLRNSNDAEAKCEYAFSRLEHAKEKMREMVEQSRAVQAEMQSKIDILAIEKEKAETQLEYQILRMRNRGEGARMDREEFERERSLLESNKQLEREKSRVEAADKENDKLREKITDLLKLNEDFARQAIELGARVRVYADHNERLATTLSFIAEEKIATERENEMIRAELLDLNRFHQLKDQFDTDPLSGNKSNSNRPVELRAQRYCKGSNNTRPRHLQFGLGMITRIILQKNAVSAIVADVMRKRRIYLSDPESTAMDLSTFFRDYMMRKHGSLDAVQWCYAVDESCLLFDDDVNLLTFQMVINNKLSELVYHETTRDINILMGACEVLDCARNSGGDAKLIVSLGDVVGLLIEMFPGYPDSFHKKLIETLMSTLSSSSQVHYRMLISNLELLEIGDGIGGSSSGAGGGSVLTQSEMRSETSFGGVFKQFIVDDIALTAQQFEDQIFDSSTSEMLTWADINVAINHVFGEENKQATAEVTAMFRRVMFENFGTSASDGAFSVSKHQLIHIVRRKMLLRRSLFKPLNLDEAPKRAKLLLSSIGRSSDNTLQHIATEAGLSDFRAAMNKCEVHRRSYREEEDRMIAAKLRRDSLIASPLSSGAFSPAGSQANLLANARSRGSMSAPSFATAAASGGSGGSASNANVLSANSSSASH